MAARATYSILSQLLVFFIFAYSLSINGITGTSIYSQQKEFDYFVFSLQWPVTYCQQTQSSKCCKQNACCNGGNMMDFTIHGLWPQYNDGTWPSCCSQIPFNQNNISSLQSELETYWPTMSCSSPSSCNHQKGSFWAHEWGKHGTCAAPVMQNEYDYFDKTLNLYFNYNVTKVLCEAKIEPSNSETYPLTHIITAIEDAFHTTPLISCSNGAVEELHLCFDKDLKPRDNCASTDAVTYEVKSSEGGCPPNVTLPAYTNLGLENGRVPNQSHRYVEAL